jgi:hypothetical protein
VGEQGGNFHLRQNVPRASRPVKRP